MRGPVEGPTFEVQNAYDRAVNEQEPAATQILVSFAVGKQIFDCEEVRQVSPNRESFCLEPLD